MPLNLNVRQTQRARSLNHPSTSNQALMKVRSWNAARSAANTRRHWRATRRRHFAVTAGSVHSALVAESPASPNIRSARTSHESGSWACALAQLLHARRQAAQGWSEYGRAKRSCLQARGAGCTVPSVTVALPNPSLERTSTGMALVPRAGADHHPPRGPSTTLVAFAQLKR
jgi:hypothetical protein